MSGNKSENTSAPSITPTRKSRWSGRSATNTSHLQNMLRGGDVEYFTAVSEGFGLAAGGDIEAAVSSLGDFLPEGAIGFITATNSRQSKAEVAAAASSEARSDMIRKMFSSNVLAGAIAAGVVTDDEAKAALDDEQYASLQA